MADVAEQRKWEVESAASTLAEASKIKRKPKLYKAAIAELKKRQKDIGRAISANK